MRILNLISENEENLKRFLRATYRTDPDTGLPNLISPRQHIRFFNAILNRVFPSLNHKTVRKAQKAFRKKYLNPSGPEKGFLGSKKQHGKVFPKYFFQLSKLSSEQLMRADDFLVSHSFSEYSPEQLWSHMDLQGDLRGKIFQNFLAIRDLEEVSGLDPEIKGLNPKIIFDARCLQDSGLRDRGIGVFALAALESIADLRNVFEIFLLTDSNLPPLLRELSRDFKTVTSVRELVIGPRDVLIQPSPLTSSPVPLVPVLKSGIYSIAIVYDFIPAYYPSVYLQTQQQISQYSACLKALNKYKTLVAISQSVSQEIKQWLPDFAGQIKIGWPRAYLDFTDIKETKLSENQKNITVTIISGAEPRKNLFYSLKSLKNVDCKINILGMSNNSQQVVDFAKALGVPLERINIVPRVSEATKKKIIRESSAILVLAYAEGLSLPVIEGLISGVPVLASDIPPHRDLLGKGFWLLNLKNLKNLEQKLIKLIQLSDEVIQNQRSAFSSILPDSLEEQLHADLVTHYEKPIEIKSNVFIHSTNSKMRLGICTPWAPLKTGVAHYSMATLPHLSDYCDLTLYTIGNRPKSSEQNISFDSFDNAYVKGVRQDALLSVMGNSFYHLPVYHFLKRYGGFALCHDSAMLDFFDELNGLRPVYGNTKIVMDSRKRYENQGELEDLNFADIANSSEKLLFHNRSISSRVAEETNSPTDFLRFIPMRVPSQEWLEQKTWKSLDSSIASSKKTWTVITLGFLSDSRKLNTVLVEACLWLRQWGVEVNLIFVGSGPQDQIDLIYQATGYENASWLSITGFVDEKTMLKYLTEADYFVQLRLGDVAMMSGPTFDAAAFGLRGVVTPNLSDSQTLPSYISVTDENVSPIVLAQTMYEDFKRDTHWSVINQERHEFVINRTPKKYAEELIEKVFS